MVHFPLYLSWYLGLQPLGQVSLERVSAVQVLRHTHQYALETVYSTADTYQGRRLRVDDRLDLLEHLGRELRQHLERLEVVKHLLGLARAENDSRGRLLRAEPREREVLDLAVELCVTR